MTGITPKSGESSIFERLALARAEFNEKGDFKKVKTDGLKFSYLPIEAAKPIIEECTAKYGVTIIPISYEILEGDNYTYKYEKISYEGKKTVWTYMTAYVHFVIACPEDKIELDILSEATDNSDKVINKVYTMAYKNLVKIVFGFAESPKDDNDSNQTDVPRKVPENDPFFKKEAKTEVKKDPEPKTAEPPKQYTEEMRAEFLKEIALKIKADAGADMIARSFLGRKKAFSELPTDVLSEIVDCLRGENA